MCIRDSKATVTKEWVIVDATDQVLGRDGCYIITIGSNALALKAAHNAPSEPKPDPDGPQ